jgi:hypothetical protein
MDHLLVSARPFWTSFFRHNRVKRQDSLRVTRPQQNPARHFVVRADRGRGMAPDVLVTVVVPAYNAARTIGETLRSVRGQSHRNLEILVVDDGATDETAEIVRAHAVEDSRVRLLTQSNAGVAAARNRGIAEARGEFVATVDADDLWRWDKVERQLIAFAEAGDSVGLVYSWYARIDGRGDVIKMASVHPRGRDLLEALALRNFVGNGSSPMFRRSLAQAIGGYDPTLRARNAQGCEDWRFYFQAAERCDFALIPDYLVGYRLLPDAMSSDFRRALHPGGAANPSAALAAAPHLATATDALDVHQRPESALSWARREDPSGDVPPQPRAAVEGPRLPAPGPLAQSADLAAQTAEPPQAVPLVGRAAGRSRLIR